MQNRTILKFHYHNLCRNLTNFSFLRHTRFAGFIVSMHMSGTHWFKYMLATAIARKYRLPQPEFNHANDIIGGPRDPRIYPTAPLIANSHSIPSPLLGCRAIRRLLKIPRYVVLVRDLRATLVSCYEKWKAKYGCDFPEYLRGDIYGKRFHHDIWWCVRFYNAWGSIVGKYPETTMVVRYEDLQKDAFCQINRANEFLSLGLDEESILFAVAESSRDKMKNKNDPARASGAGIISSHGKKVNEVFSSNDNLFIKDVCRALLKYEFGYHY